jgi:hypothetical protein
MSLEQETILALIEAKENLEKARDLIHTVELDPTTGALRDEPYHARRRVNHALALIESILARGR